MYIYLKFSEQGQWSKVPSLDKGTGAEVHHWNKEMSLDKMTVLYKTTVLDPAIWSRLPEDLVNKICNMIPKLLERNNALLEEIRFQTHKYSRWYYNTASLFGFDNAHFIMYDDMRNVLHVPDTFPEVITIDLVVEGMWRSLTHEQRDEIILLC